MEDKKIARINKKELFKEKARIGYLQIAILIISSFAVSYLLAMADDSIGIARAETALNCCPRDKNGVFCNEYPSSECNDKCAVSCQQTKCSEFVDCKLGCCYDKAQGTCSANSPKAKCESDGGSWTNSPECNVNKVQECKLGCCVLGANTEFVTKDRCLKLANERGLPADFRAGITNEAACIFLSIAEEKGACLLEGGGCKMLTNQECKSLTGKLTVAGTLCTSKELKTDCKPTDNTICIEGKDEVYFVDSCGNPANIYDASKTYSKNKEYWEKIVKKEDACNSKDLKGNAGSGSCGNCNYYLGSKCKSYQKAGISKPNYGENVCADMSCKNAPANVGKQDRRNGESWCVYDSAIGDGNDVPGSRHWKYSCIDGEVKIEPCQDYRNEICTQEDTQMGSEKFSSAACRINNWQACIAANTQTGECRVDCFKKSVSLGSGFSFNFCIPKYPPGFELTTGKESFARQICGMASQSCTVIYEKKLSGWKCKKNCDCRTEAFTKQMNELCRSLGDCGGEVNIAGEYTENYGVVNAPKLSPVSVDSLVKLSKPVEGQKAESGELNELLQSYGFNIYMEGEEEGKDISMLLGLGGSASLLIAPFLKGESIATFGNALMSAGIAMTATTLIIKLFKLKGKSAEIVSYVGIAGATTLFAGSMGAFGTESISFFMAGGPVFWIVLAVIILAAGLMKLFKLGEVKRRVVTFTCRPWQAPTGGDDCEKCAQKDKTCSKYRCESLGQACQFVNEGTKAEACISAKDDGTAPVISPWPEILSENFTYTNISEKGFSIREKEGGCIQAFTPFSFGIKTNKASQCKFDTSSKIKFEDMENDFGSNSVLFNHSIGASMPSIDSVLAEFNEEKLTYQYALSQIGDLRLYTRCKDIFGHYNPTEYVIDICIKPGPDETAPLITAYEPENGVDVANNAVKKDVNIYLNEPAECKYSKQDKSYSAMENSFACSTGLQDAGVRGWQCNATLTGLVKGENNFYFRCRDQPWLPAENASQRNENTESYSYKLKVSASPLEIRKITPNGSLSFGSEPIAVDLIAETSGGIDGKAKCEYSFSGTDESYIMFLDTFATTHKQRFNMMLAGDYIIYVKCVDDANNIATGTTSILLNIDNSAPMITRAYKENGKLYIFTNEKSECAYSSSCNFIFENGTQMTGGFSQEHSTGWTPGQAYYIKCRDAWGNEPVGCSIKIKAYSLEQ